MSTELDRHRDAEPAPHLAKGSDRPDRGTDSWLDPDLDGPLAGRRALVLGATGMIGAHTTRALLARGVLVRALVRPTSPAENLRGLEVERVEGDLFDAASLVRAAHGCDLFVHAAAPYPRGHFRAEAQTRRAVASIGNVLAAARSVENLQRLVYVSSLTTIGPPRPDLGSSGGPRPAKRPIAREADTFDPSRERSPYFRMKAAMETEVLRAAGEGLPAVIVNPSLCLDTLDVTPTTAQLLVGVAAGRLRVGLPGIVDVVATRDVAVGIARALVAGRVGERYILGGETLPMRELIARIAAAAGQPAPRGTVPLGLLEVLGWSAEVLNLVTRRPWPLVPLSSVRMLKHATPLDTSKARMELRLPHTPIDVAIRDAFAWLAARDAHGARSAAFTR